MSNKKPRGSQITITDELAQYIARLGLLATNIRSTAFANITDLVCEGEIEGFANADPLKSTYLDETPIRNPDGSDNFSGVQLDYRTGTQSQTYMRSSSEVQDDVFVNVKATFASPVTRQITNAAIDAAVVKLTTPSLTYVNQTTGEINGNSVAYKIQLQSNGGGYVDVVSSELIGKSTSQYQRSHRIELTGSAPWDIRVVRVTADPVTDYDSNLLYFDSYTEVIDVKLAFPNSAVVSLKVDAAKFSNIPRRAFDVKMLKIRIPSNATVREDGSLTYSGSWDGTFQTAWSSNPAWCFFDLVSSERYGLGTFIPESQIDKWSIYSVGVYCDELVDNLLGGTEPRFSCNIYLQSQNAAYQVIQDMTSIFRGMSYWANGSLSVVQDSPSDPVYLYTQANVAEGNFNYSGASRRAKHSVALVAWNDPSDFFRQKIEMVEDQDAIASMGVVKTQVTAVGCTSRGQAHRVGKWILFSEQNESEIISFTTGIEGAVARPGQIVNVADSNRSGRRTGGRISTATTTSVTIDSDPDDSYVGATIFVLLANNTVESRVIDTQNGRVFTVVTPFSTAPASQAIWMISSDEVEVQSFRILNVATNKSGEVEISGIKHIPDKYSAVEDGTQLEERTFTTLTENPDTPEDLLVTENLFNSITGVRNKVTLSWTHVQGVSGYAVKYQKDEENFVNLPPTFINEVEILDITPGTYKFVVYSVSFLGKLSTPASLTQVVYGKTAAPNNVSNFSMFPGTNNSAQLTWTQSTDLDVLVGGSVRIRHTPRITGQTWGSSVDVVDFVAGSDTFATVPLLYGTYMAKFVDSSGNESVTESIIVTTIPIPQDLNVVEFIDETIAPFGGTKTNTQYDSGLGGLILTDVTLLGTYLFQNTVNLGAVFSSDLTANIKVLAFDTGGDWDDDTSDIDDWVDIDGSNLSSVNAKLYVRTTEDDPAGSPTWTVWKPFFTGSYLARGFQFKLELESTSPTENICILDLDVTIDMPDRVENHSAIVSGAASYTLTFDHEFNAVPTIGITAHNMGTGDYYTISSKTAAAFTIIFKNSAGTTVSRTFDAIIKGYGLKG